MRGPVRMTGTDGRVVVSDRVVVAVCRCRLSSIHPLCDTSHRALLRHGRELHGHDPHEDDS
ncbi:CDGSH iron-sulfur domain-containing protein [Rhodococcus gannanensis]|uniref:CDGSH iron-sulfur domain-containing protein n=1 Tax=Rhodococcus gannanensis TaxID=1960308 RepID=A0ABW4P6P9_9NOCA